MFRKTIWLVLSVNILSCSLFGFEPKDSVQQKKLKPFIITIANAAIYTGGLSYLQFVWYKDYERVPFNFYNDLDGWLQMDKAGHILSSYFINKNAFQLYHVSGLSHQKALLYSGITAFAYMTPIEIFDGIYEGYGFSTTDIVANTIGSAIFLVQEAVWKKHPVKVKFSYRESGYHQYHPYNLGKGGVETFFLDYNGHTYWLSANFSDFGVAKIPAWLNIAIGYSANGMLAEFKNPKSYRGNTIPDLPRYRQFYISPDIDLEKIKTKNKALKTLLYVINFIKVPLPAIEFNKESGVRWVWF